MFEQLDDGSTFRHTGDSPDYVPPGAAVPPHFTEAAAAVLHAERLTRLYDAAARRMERGSERHRLAQLICDDVIAEFAAARVELERVVSRYSVEQQRRGLDRDVIERSVRVGVVSAAGARGATAEAQAIAETAVGWALAALPRDD